VRDPDSAGEPRGSILLLEEDAHVREVLVGALHAEGYRVLAVPEARALLSREDQALPAAASLIILHARQGQDPLSPVAALRARGLAGPVLLITPENAPRQEADGPYGIARICEPYAVADLVATAAALLRQAREEGRRR
jgi:DNA-binding response OmpR family regulator